MYTLMKRNKKDKKFMVRNDDKTVHFGAKGYSDYTIHKDKKRMFRYTKRHEKREDWNDPKTAGFWSKHILWNKPSLYQSIKDTEKRYNVKINTSRINK